LRESLAQRRRSGFLLHLNNPEGASSEAPSSLSRKRVEMPDLETARVQLESARKNYEAAMKVPAEDNFPVGTILRWSYRNGQGQICHRAAHKMHEMTYDRAKNWMMVGFSGAISYDYLVSHIAVPELVKVEMVFEWKDITVQPDPGLEVLAPEQSGYKGLILRDRKRNIAWELQGTEWVRVFEE
jgi:hypothetical protein